MTDTVYRQYVKPYNDDPSLGHLATPISASGFTKAFIGNLPIYRKGLSPLLRGLEIGLAHGYFLMGPWTELGALRDSDVAALGGLICALALILIATACMSIYGIASFQGEEDNSQTDTLQSSEGWSQLAGGFFIGASGGAIVAYFLISNFNVIDGILRGTFNT